MMQAAVGVDIVWLGEPRKTGRAADDRFVGRILAPEEQALLSAAPPQEADLLLWRFWAGKEAAFKVVSKLEGAPPPFRHAAFVHTPATGEGPEGRQRGSLSPGEAARSWVVRWRRHRVPVRSVLHHPEALVATATAPGRPGVVTVGAARTDEPGQPWSGPLRELLGLLTARERAAVHSLASAAVRVAAKMELAALLGVDRARVEIVCAPGVTGRRPPFLFLDGRRAPGLDVSLAHDGPWLAWAVAGDPSEGTVVHP